MEKHTHSYTVVCSLDHHPLCVHGEHAHDCKQKLVYTLQSRQCVELNGKHTKLHFVHLLNVRAVRNHEIHTMCKHSFCMLDVGESTPTMPGFYKLECFASFLSGEIGTADTWPTNQPTMFMSCWSQYGAHAAWNAPCDFERDVREQYCHLLVGHGRKSL